MLASVSLIVGIMRLCVVHAFRIDGIFVAQSAMCLQAAIDLCGPERDHSGNEWQQPSDIH